LENGIRIKERIPAAYNNYEIFEFKITVSSKNGNNSKEFFGAEVIGAKLEIIDFEFDSIEVEIRNDCGDVLKMNFILI